MKCSVINVIFSVMVKNDSMRALRDAMGRCAFWIACALCVMAVCQRDGVHLDSMRALRDAMGRCAFWIAAVRALRNGKSKHVYQIKTTDSFFRSCFVNTQSIYVVRRDDR